MLTLGTAKTVGILDCDNHYGNGTGDIIKSLGNEDRITHFTTGKSHFEPVSFLKTLADRLRNLYSACDVVLYQAGADLHINDTLGGWMTTAQLHERDVIVFEIAREMRLPVAWNFAGGYQRDANGQILPVLQIHYNTMKACLSGHQDGLFSN